MVATFKTSRMSVVVSKIVGKTLNSCGERIASVVRMTTTATVRLTDSKTSSNCGEIGTTKTRMAPTIVTGRTSPRTKPRRHPVASISTLWEAPFPLHNSHRRHVPTGRATSYELCERLTESHSTRVVRFDLPPGPAKHRLARAANMPRQPPAPESAGATADR